MSTFLETTAYRADFEIAAPGNVNRRRHERHPVSGRVLIFRSEDVLPSISWLENLSTSGVLIRTDEL